MKTAILAKVIEYCKHHKDNPPADIRKPLKDTNLNNCGVSEWDTEFVNIDHEILFDLVSAANYLDIESLLDLACANVVTMMRHPGAMMGHRGAMGTEAICERFGIVYPARA